MILFDGFAETEIISCNDEKDVIKRFPRTNDIFQFVSLFGGCTSRIQITLTFSAIEFLDFFDNDDTEYGLLCGCL
jgi:hypothetical protein